MLLFYKGLFKQDSNPDPRFIRRIRIRFFKDRIRVSESGKIGPDPQHLLIRMTVCHYLNKTDLLLC